MSASQNESLEERDSNGSNYTHGNLYKVPICYNVNASAKTVSMELTQYISKVTEMVPDNLLVNWYWIGTSSTVDTANLALDG